MVPFVTGQRARDVRQGGSRLKTRSRTQAATPPQRVAVNGQQFEVWPANQRVGHLGDETVRYTDFDDADRYHAALTDKILAAENDPRQAEHLFKGGCGTKLRQLEAWRLPAARLVNARALRLCQSVLGTEALFVDDAWANIYRPGDYCMPHSHLRSVASVVYFLALGEPDPEHPMSGRFCIGDPRLRAFCRMEDGRMTHSMAPEVRPGTMIIFPSQLVHFVNPYTGQSPRITLAWNFTTQALAGNARDDWQKA
jgi:hypothetical protein